MPSLTPAGIFTVKRFVRRSRPALARRARRVDEVPLPRHFGQGCCRANNPCDVATTPLPPHCGQRFGAVPGAAPVPWHVWHASSSSTGTVDCNPFNESSNEICTATSTSLPRWPRCC